MVCTVVEAHAHVLDRVAGHRAGLHGLLDALLDRRDEAARDDAALDRVHELEARSLGERLELDVAVGELAPPTRLLLVAGVRLRAAPDRLEVGHARRLERDLRPVALAHPLHDDLDVDLGQPGHDLLSGLIVAVHVDRRVLLAQAAQRGEDLVLVALGLGLDRERHHRVRHRRQRQRDVLLGGGQHVARLGLLQLRHGADVPRPELIGVLGVVLALRHEQLADALLGVRAAVRAGGCRGRARPGRRGTG